MNAERVLMPKIYLFVLIFLPLNAYSEEIVDDSLVIKNESANSYRLSLLVEHPMLIHSQKILLSSDELALNFNTLTKDLGGQSLFLISTTAEKTDSTKKYCCYWGEIGIEPGVIILLGILTVSYLAYLYSQGIP